MTIKEQTVALAMALAVTPSDVVVKVCIFIVQASEKHWEKEAMLRSAKVAETPKDSPLRLKAEQEYNTAFGHWHRLTMLRAALISGVSRPTYGTPDQVQQAA